MSAAGRIGGFYWAEVPRERAEVRGVVRSLGSRLRGLTAVNVSWDSGRMQELAGVPPGWSVRDNYVISPPVDDAMLADWPQSTCHSGRYDEWYFFRVVPEVLELRAFCNWGGVSLASSGDLAFPGGFDLAAQLEASKPSAVVGEGSAVFVIAPDEATVRQFLDGEREAQMNPRLSALFDRIRESPLYEGVAFDDINAANSDGDNALHWAVHFNDLEAARLLIDAGIDVDQRGDLGRTPLHEACGAGHGAMALLLIAHGADLHAQTEGDVPFALARLGGHDAVCDLLKPLMEQAHEKDGQVWLRVRIAHLERELRRLKALLR